MRDEAKPTEAGTAVAPPAPVPPAPAGRRLRLAGRLAAVLVLLALIGLGAAVAAQQGLALYHTRLGRACLERYHDREALAHLQVALQIWPHDPATLFLTARAARRVAAFDDARRYLEECGGWNQDELTLERALLAAQRGDVDAVAKYCQAQLDRGSPATPLILEALTSGSLRSYRVHEAEAYVRQWVGREPDNPQARYLEGQVEERLDKLPEAAAAYRRALELDPTRDDVRQHLADVLVDLLQPEQALPHLEYLRQRLPDELRSQVRLAQCREQLGQPDEAEKVLDDVLARQPGYALALVERGKLDLDAGRLPAAEARLREACNRQPGDYQAHYLLQQCLSRQGKTAEAKEVAAQLQQLDADNQLYHDILTSRMEQSPHDPALHYQVGRILLRSGSPEEGLAWLQSALREDPHYGPAHEALADYYEVMGNRGLAARHRALAEEAKGGKPAADAPTPKPE